MNAVDAEAVAPSVPSFYTNLRPLEPEGSNPQTAGAPDATGVLERFGLYGDVPTRVMNWAVRFCPLYLEPIFIAVYTFLFWLVCPAPRRAIAANLAVVIPGSSRHANTLRSLRVFWNFANSCVDAARVAAEGDVIDWEIVGVDHFQELADLPADQGAIILTAHMGNYDVAAPVFARRFRRRVHAVRAPERVAHTQSMYDRDATRRGTASDDELRIAYNTGDNFLGIDLMESLAGGDAVAIQGDRILFDVSPLHAELCGAPIRYPKGPFTLALAARAPIYPVFIIRTGRRRYQVRVEPAFRCERHRDDGRDKFPALARAATGWTRALEPIVRRHWHQWYVFEPVFADADQ